MAHDHSPSPAFVPLAYTRYSPTEMQARARSFLDEIRTRRSVRHFSRDPVPAGVLEACVEAAAQAPSGANKQPWTFVVVTDPALKQRIRAAAEAEEREFYAGRAPERWLADLAALGTNPNKPFLEEAPALVVVFAQTHGVTADERRKKGS